MYSPFEKRPKRNIIINNEPLTRRLCCIENQTIMRDLRCVWVLLMLILDGIHKSLIFVLYVVVAFIEFKE